MSKRAELRPLIYLDSFAEVIRRTRKFQDRRTYTMVTDPKDDELGHGRCGALAPRSRDVEAVRVGALTLPAFRDKLRAHFQQMLERGVLGPGQIIASPYAIAPWTAVINGDAVCCRCLAGRPCHRRWLAPYLEQAGWHVILDGADFDAAAPPAESW